MMLPPIKLIKNGLILMGARLSETLTTTSIDLTKSEQENKTLLVSYKNYKAQMIDDDELSSSKSLIIDTTFPYFEIEYFNQLKKAIKEEGYKIVILDDLNTLINDSQYDNSYSKDFIIRGFKQVVDEFGISVVLNVVLPETVDERSGDKSPLLSDFNWSRQILEQADQIIGLYEPSMYGIAEDEDGNSVGDQVAVLTLKPTS